MKKNIIGLMSGTSCDGLDLVYCQFQELDGVYSYSLLESDFIPYDETFAKRLKEAINLSAPELMKLHHKFGDYLGNQVKSFVERFGLKEVDWVSSHGHTVLHRPSEGYTFQIGRGENIKEACGIPVICDFRVQDVVLGGQGAPLVPVGDHFLFSTYSACVNLGGFSNISLMKGIDRIAFDISPFNILMNPLAEKLGFPFDKGGELAREGKLNTALLSRLDSFEYYHQSPPKSLSLEDVQVFFAPLLNEYDLPVRDFLNTLVVHFVEQLVRSLPNHGKILLTGGGTKNNYFVELLKERYSGEIVIPSIDLIDFKEAIVFAFLGFLRSENKENIFATVTGASKDHSSGCIFN